MQEAQRRRLAPEARKDLLLDAAQQTFATRGYTQSGLAEIAQSAGVSKTLLYHYFPEGRPELYRAVMARLTTAVVESLRDAARAPVSADRRLTRLIDALLSFFEEEPAAYRLIIVEPWGAGDPSVIGQAMAVRASLTSELAGVLTLTDQPVERTTAGASAAMGALLQVCELRAAGVLGGLEARQTAGDFVRGGLVGLGLL